MGKPSGGGTTSIFTLKKTGSGNVTAETWFDLGVIDSGFDWWVGSAQYSSPSKTTTFELRTNLATKSSGSTTDTQIMSTASASKRTGTVTVDMYKSGLLHTATVVGSGVEKMWIRCTSATATAFSCSYTVNYLKE